MASPADGNAGMNDDETFPAPRDPACRSADGRPAIIDRLAAVIDALPQAVIVLDPAGTCRINAPALRIFGPLPPERPATPLDGLCSHLHLRCADEDAPIPPAEHPCARALRGEECSRDVIVNDHGSGEELMLRCHAHPLREDERIVGAIVCHVDISDLRRSTARLRRINQDLEQFSAIASHDLQEPLRIVRSYLGLLDFRQSIKGDEVARRHLAFAEESAARLQRMLANLLDITRISRQGLKRVRFNASAAVAEALESLGQAVIEVGATVSVPELPMVYADRSFLVILLRNLIGNALKYRHPDRPCRIAIDAWQGPRDETVFAVSDSGIGIAAEHRETIFAPFHRLPNATPGNGLGLDICRRIVERHGGSIWVDSTPGVGSTFRFVIPAAQEAGSLGRLPYLDGRQPP